MIQDSMNQMLGIAGALGTYAKNKRIDMGKADIDNKMKRMESIENKGILDNQSWKAYGSKLSGDANKLSNKLFMPNQLRNYMQSAGSQAMTNWQANEIGMMNAKLAVQSKVEQAENAFTNPKVWTPGDIRREQEAEKKKEDQLTETAKKKGIAERDLGI